MSEPHQQTASLPSADLIQAFELLRLWYGVRHYTMEEFDTAWMTVVRVREGHDD